MRAMSGEVVHHGDHGLSGGHTPDINKRHRITKRNSKQLTMIKLITVIRISYPDFKKDAKSVNVSEIYSSLPNRRKQVPYTQHLYEMDVRKMLKYNQPNK